MRGFTWEPLTHSKSLIEKIRVSLGPIHCANMGLSKTKVASRDKKGKKKKHVKTFGCQIPTV